MAIKLYLWVMKTTIDLPDELLHRAKIVAAQRKTTFKQLVEAGLDCILRSDTDSADRAAALNRLRTGLRLGGKPLARNEAHERH
jgi:hypothetical protein